MDVAANATLHIGVHGWEATDYVLSTTATDTGGGGGGTTTGGELTAGQSTDGTLALQEWHHYTLAPAAQERTATVTFGALTGDGDLYVKLGAQADSSSYDCKSDNGSTSEESCTLTVPANVSLQEHSVTPTHRAQKL